MPRRVRVALLNDYEVVVRGLGEMLAPHADRLEVVEFDVRRFVVGQQTDVALYDTFTVSQVDQVEIDQLINDERVSRVAVYSWNMHPALVAQAELKGIGGYLSKSLSGDELADALLRVAAGESVVSPRHDIAVDPADIPVAGGDWPGRRQGLSARQSEVMSLLTQGLTNDEIAGRAYLSVNTVKTYLREAYAIAGVRRRSQAILWGLDHGMSAPVPQRFAGAD